MKSLVWDSSESPTAFALIRKLRRPCQRFNQSLVFNVTKCLFCACLPLTMQFSKLVKHVLVYLPRKCWSFFPFQFPLFYFLKLKRTFIPTTWVFLHVTWGQTSPHPKASLVPFASNYSCISPSSYAILLSMLSILGPSLPLSWQPQCETCYLTRMNAIHSQYFI